MSNLQHGIGGTTGLGPVTRGANHGGVTSNLRDEIKEVPVSVRAVGGKSLVTIVEVGSRSVKTLDGKLGEVEVRRTTGGVLLRSKEKRDEPKTP